MKGKYHILLKHRLRQLNATRFQVRIRFHYVGIGKMNFPPYLGSPGCGLNAAIIG